MMYYALAHVQKFQFTWDYEFLILFIRLICIKSNKRTEFA